VKNQVKMPSFSSGIVKRLLGEPQKLSGMVESARIVLLLLAKKN
jgi:hypothetical protein